MRSSVKVFDSPEKTADMLADEFVKVLNKEAESGRTVNVAFSGGNTPRLFFSALSRKHKKSIDWNNVQFFWVDERCVPPSDSQSNYRVAWKYLLDKINISGSNVHRIRGEEDPEWEAARYSFLVFNSLPASNNFPVFDIILLGLGNDGHTASIFPDQMELIDTEKIFAISKHPETGQLRITMTGRLINNARHIFFLVSGADKAEMVSEILNEGSEVMYPAAFIKPLEGTLDWYLDKYAAGLVRS